MQVPAEAAAYHSHVVGPNQCGSVMVQPVAAPVAVVWSVVGRFESPQAYKRFVKSCRLVAGDGAVGSLRQVHVVSGLPAATSTERLEMLDDEHHVISFRVVGGDHRLVNYKSVTSLHPSPAGEGATLVVESYVVDVPPGNSPEETCFFADTIVRCNLQSLAQVAENLARRGRSSSPP
ncbi:abscisic acid receptor PYL4-like [Wolffia australiana]